MTGRKKENSKYGKRRVKRCKRWGRRETAGGLEITKSFRVNSMNIIDTARLIYIPFIDFAE